MSTAPGQRFAPRQSFEEPDYTTNPAKSLPLETSHQALLDDILSLYCCQATAGRVSRYTADEIYDDELSYANDRDKIAGQRFALPKLFFQGKSLRHEVVTHNENLIQIKNEQQWKLRLVQRSVTTRHFISLSMAPD